MARKKGAPIPLPYRIVAILLCALFLAWMWITMR
jgi:hypothetical protein